jgi:sugar lactone lactonase YvrE
MDELRFNVHPPGMRARLAIDSHDRIGEGPTWDAAGQRLLWSDNETGVVHEAKPNDLGGWYESRVWRLNRPIAASIPRASGGLMIVGGTEIFGLDEASGELTPFARLDVDPNRVMLNEAKCDRQGRLWAGTLALDLKSTEGALYRIDPDGTVTPMLEQVTVSNGLDWSPDGSTLYYIDSVTLSVDAFDFDTARGTISQRRPCVRMASGDGVPDGMTVDREGCLWVAVAGAGEVRCYAPDGALRTRIAVSTPAVTSCTFGGRDGADLLITSLGRRLPDAVLALGITPAVVERSATAPGAGGVFICRPGAMGLPATPFAG